MKIIERFNFDSFCYSFCKLLIPPHINKEFTVHTRQGKTKFVDCISTEFERIKKGSNDKFDISLQIALTYKQKFLMDEKQKWFEFNDYLNKYYWEPFRIVVREELDVNRRDVAKAMREIFKANVLFLRFYDVEQNTNKNELKEYFLNQNVHLLFNEEIDEKDRISNFNLT